jgi:hypothetical protein
MSNLTDKDKLEDPEMAENLVNEIKKILEE